MIKIFLGISFGVSNLFWTGDYGRPFQGVVQGNKVALPLYCIIAMFLVRYLCIKRVLTQLITSMCKFLVRIAAFLCAYDTDSCVLNKVNDSAEAFAYKAQVLLSVWHENLTI